MSINDDVRIIMGESSVQFSSYTMSDSSLVRHCSMLHFRCTLLKSKPTEAPQEKKKKNPRLQLSFLRHKQDCFFQTFSLAASSAPQCFCDLHYSEVPKALTTSGNDKVPYHQVQVS